MKKGSDGRRTGRHNNSIKVSSSSNFRTGICDSKIRCNHSHGSPTGCKHSLKMTINGNTILEWLLHREIKMELVSLKYPRQPSFLFRIIFLTIHWEDNIRIFKNYLISIVLVSNIASSGKKEFILIPWLP